MTELKNASNRETPDQDIAAQDTPDQDTRRQNAKRYPIERYMEIRSAYGPAFDYTGDNMLFLSTLTGMPQVWSLEGTRPWPRQVTFFSDRVMSVTPSPANNYVCINADEGGSENAQLFLTDLFGSHMEDLSNDPKHIFSFGSWSPDGRQFSYASNRRDGRHFDVYTYNVDTCVHRAVHVNDSTNYAGRFSPDGRYLLVSRHYSNVNNDLFLLDLTTFDTTLLSPHQGDAVYQAARFAKNGQAVYVLTTLNSDFKRVARIDLNRIGSSFTDANSVESKFADSNYPAAETLSYLTEDQWDAETLALSSDGQYLAFTKNEDGSSKLYVFRNEPTGGTEPAQENWVAVAELPQTPAGVIAELTFHPNGQSLALTLSSPRFGTEVWLLDLHSKNLERVTYASVSGVPQETFQQPELVHYESFDGLSIPAYYYRPHGNDLQENGSHGLKDNGLKDSGSQGNGLKGNGSEENGSQGNGPFPVVVYVHGGPESQSRNSFNSVLQYLVNQGFAVLVPNVRGSSGYGLSYQHLDDVRKRMDSVADLAKSVDWLIQHGNAKAESIAVMGGSYGGFMVLAAVTHYPKLWAAGVDIVGIANLRTFMENTSPYRRHLRECEYGTVKDDGEFFDEISPIHHIDKIQAPMIVIHGANDPRVPVGEAEQVVSALKSRQHPVEYLRFEDEGHGVVKLPNRIKAYGAIAAFLNQYL